MWVCLYRVEWNEVGGGGYYEWTKRLGTGEVIWRVCVFLLECRMWGYVYLKMYRSSVGPSPLCRIYNIF